MQHDIRDCIQLNADLQCAACSPTPHSLHIDANMKLFVYDRHREPWREAYHAGQLFLPSGDCVQHMQDIDRVMGKQVGFRFSRVS